MKRVLFYYDNFCGPGSKGGTEVATSRIARALKDYGMARIYHAFLRGRDKAEAVFYDGRIKLKKPESLFVGALGDFIRENEIDVVVNMGRFFRHRKLKKSIESSGRDAKLIFMHHFAPGSEKIKGTWTSGWHLLKLNPYNPLYYLRATVYPILKLPKKLKLRKVYREVYEMSDRVILLSEGYKKDYAKISGMTDEDKFVAIPNIFQSDSIENEPPELKAKQKSVLILSRMDEIQKRISLALKVWEKIEREEDLAGWNLDILGTGHDIGIFKRMASRLSLNRVTFHGWKDSRPFLRNSSILMMPSLYEGLSLAMLEAQAAGCVPVAYDSYSSLRDIVEDNKTGVIVKDFGDIDAFAEKLAHIMRNEKLRNEMALNGASGALRFSSKNIAEKWNNLLTSL